MGYSGQFDIGEPGVINGPNSGRTIASDTYPVLISYQDIPFLESDIREKVQRHFDRSPDPNKTVRVQMSYMDKVKFDFKKADWLRMGTSVYSSGQMPWYPDRNQLAPIDGPSAIACALEDFGTRGKVKTELEFTVEVTVQKEIQINTNIIEL